MLPVTPIYVWCFVPGKQSGAGAIMRAGYCRFEHADQIRLFLRRPRAASVLLVHDEGEAAMVAREKNKDAAAGGGDGAEVAEEHVQVVTYAAAVDVAKGFGMVCTRVPGSRPDRRRQKVWRVEATYDAVVALMDHLRSEGIQRLVLESTSDYVRSEGA